MVSACRAPDELCSKGSGKSYENQPLSICDESFTPLEVRYDLDAVRGRTSRKTIAIQFDEHVTICLSAAASGRVEPNLPVGFTPLMRAKNSGKRLRATNLFINDAICSDAVV